MFVYACEIIPGNDLYMHQIYTIRAWGGASRLKILLNFRAGVRLTVPVQTLFSKHVLSDLKTSPTLKVPWACVCVCVCASVCVSVQKLFPKNVLSGI
jgi:hypothetical protein